MQYSNLLLPLLASLFSSATADGTVTFDFYSDLECRGTPFQTHKAGVFNQLHTLDNNAQFACFKIRDISQSLFGRGIKAGVAIDEDHICTYSLSNTPAAVNAPHTFDPGQYYGIGEVANVGCNFD
jgi:hypothetical protein